MISSLLVKKLLLMYEHQYCHFASAVLYILRKCSSCFCISLSFKAFLFRSFEVSTIIVDVPSIMCENVFFLFLLLLADIVKVCLLFVELEFE